MKTNGNEPISPTKAPNSDDQYAWSTTIGLTKREYFAAMAMQGSLASITGGDWAAAINVAKKSIEYADALIEELNK